MRLLLDTHALVWALSDPAQLPGTVRKTIENPSNMIYVSAVSIWEIAIKAALGKIDLEIEDLPNAITEVGFTELPVTIAHACAVRKLPMHHRDPFDRMLAVQSSLENLPLITKDPVFSLYGTNHVWNSTKSR